MSEMHELSADARGPLTSLTGRLRARFDAAVDWRAQQVVDRSTHELRDRLSALEGRVAALEPRLVEAEQAVLRLAPQTASLEKRVEDLGGAGSPVVADDRQVAEARQLLDAVRSEHERIRARTALLSSYEERLRLLEGRG